MSKYIGETEKHLRQVFDAAEDGGAMLLFDEADALFGRRSEVRDSRPVRQPRGRLPAAADRGVPRAGDPDLQACGRWTRRSCAGSRFVAFPYPDPVLRERLWERAFPVATPVADLDAHRLAALDLPGGGIASVALTAAFLAAADGGVVRQEHVRTAARWELAKSGRSATTSGGPRGR